MLEPSHRKALRDRVMGWRAAAARETELRRHEGPLDSGEAIDFALEAWALNPHAFETHDPIREREVEQARQAWAKLRERLGWQQTTA
jgi:hypothetical protein